MPKNLIFILLFLLPGMAAEQYILGYRGVVREHRFFNDTFSVARAMSPRPVNKIGKSYTLPVPKDDTPIPLFFQAHQDAIVQWLLTSGVLVTDRQNTHMTGTETKTVLTLPPTYALVAIKEDFVTITLFE